VNSFGEFVEVWPAHRSETLPAPTDASADTARTASVDAAIPPTIAALDYSPSLRTVGTSEAALIAVAQADMDAAGSLAALSKFMIRCESIASSRIDGVGARPSEYAMALAGVGEDEDARRVVAAAAALDALLAGIDAHRAFTVDDVLSAHAVLFEGSDAGASAGGCLRSTQTWRGSPDSPGDASYVPPGPARVPALLGDLVAYLNRDDVPVIVQAAIAHAQFASIRPFTRGNGRIGRALVAASLRRRGVSTHATVPIACGLLARPEEYLESLVAYRDGDPSPIIVLVATCARVAATESRATVARVKELPDVWRGAVKPRRGSAAAALIPAFAEHPAMGAGEIERFSGAGRAQAYQAVERLEAAGVIREVTSRKRGRVWVATDLMTELDDLDARIQSGMRGGRKEETGRPPRG
jgi:Fic family protein